MNKYHTDSHLIFTLLIHTIDIPFEETIDICPTNFEK